MTSLENWWVNVQYKQIYINITYPNVEGEEKKKKNKKEKKWVLWVFQSVIPTSLCLRVHYNLKIYKYIYFCIFEFNCNGKARERQIEGKRFLTSEGKITKEKGWDSWSLVRSYFPSFYYYGVGCLALFSFVNLVLCKWGFVGLSKFCVFQVLDSSLTFTELVFFLFVLLILILSYGL